MKFITEVSSIFKGSNNRTDLDTYEFQLLKKIGNSMDIPEVIGLKDNAITLEQKKEIFLRHNLFHKKFMSKYCSGFKYYEKMEDLENDDFDVNSHLMQSEKIKETLKEKKHILLVDSRGKKTLGVFLPDISIDIEFDEIIIIGSSIYNYFYGKGRDSKSFDITLSGILQHMESREINDLGIDPINDFQFIISAEIAKQNILLRDRPTVKEVILNVYNEAMIEMGKDHTTELPTMTGLLKKELVTKEGTHTLRTFRFNFIKIKNGLTLSIRRFMNYDEIDGLGLDGLGYLEKAKKLTKLAIDEKKGANLILGETNSGKSTLLAALLNPIYKEKNKIIAIENPIEILMPYLQIDLTDTETADEQYKMTKEIAQKAILRHNPNVVLISEIRTKDEIDFYAGLGLRGHMAFATLHAGSVENAIEILLKIVEESELRNILNLFIHQELIAKKCNECSGAGVITKTNGSTLECGNCEGVGSDGVLPVYEIAKFNKLGIGDSLRDLGSLVKKGKLTYISKQSVIEELHAENKVHEADYKRIINLKKIGD